MFNMLTLLYALNTYLTLTEINKYCIWSFTFFQFTYCFRLVICHIWYWFSIDTKVLHFGIVSKPKLWYRAIPRVHRKIVEYLKNNVPQHKIVKALQISSSTVYNIIKSFRETGEISVRKGQGRRPLLDASGLWALRRHCITHRYDSVIDITK